MDIRRDALVGAAKLISAVDRKARTFLGGTDYLVATIGHLVLTPNASNAVPGSVEMMLEVRSDRQAILEVFSEELLAAVEPELKALGLELRHSRVSQAAPTDCDEGVMQAIDDAAAALGYASRRMPSGAGHDAVYLAKTGPVGMVFIPCLNGRSHCPEESITPEQLLDGTRVLCQTLLTLDRRLAA